MGLVIGVCYLNFTIVLVRTLVKYFDIEWELHTLFFTSTQCIVKLLTFRRLDHDRNYWFSDITTDSSDVNQRVTYAILTVHNCSGDSSDNAKFPMLGVSHVASCSFTCDTLLLTLHVILISNVNTKERGPWMETHTIHWHAYIGYRNDQLCLGHKVTFTVRQWGIRLWRIFPYFKS